MAKKRKKASRKKGKKKKVSPAKVVKALDNFSGALEEYGKVLVIQAEAYKKKAAASNIRKRIKNIKKSLTKVKAVMRRL